MQAIEFPDQSAVIGVEQGYLPLPIKRMTVLGPKGPIHTFFSKWKPDEEELKKLNAGEPVTVMLRTLMSGHPPMKVEVE
jgi:hypothetical protein